MGPVPGRNRRLESALSILLLAILLLIGLGVFKRQLDTGASRFGVNTTIAGLSSQKMQPEAQELALDSLPPAGFKELSAVETYDPENLYEKINGKAPLYIESGFVKLSTQRFISMADEALWMELFVYDMATIRNAFSIFSVQRRADVDILSLFDTSFGYRTDNSLYFIHGKYYVELLGSAESVALFEAIIEVAQKMMNRLDADGGAEMTELDLFGGDNRIEGSCKLYLRNAFGFEGLTDVFTYRYRFGDESVTVFLSRRPDPNDARARAKSYRDFLIRNEATAKKANNKSLEGGVYDFYDTTEIVLATGPFVVGIHEAESQQSAEELVLTLIDKLGEAAKAEK
jgi:hypothetical protein